MAPIGGRRAGLSPAVILLAAGLACAGCAGGPGARDRARGVAGSVALEVRFLDEGRELLPASAPPEDLVLDLAFVPGAVYGAALSGTVLRLPLAGDGRVHLDPDGMRDLARRYAVPLLATEFNQGIVTDPPGARLVRVGTFARRRALEATAAGTGIFCLVGDRVHDLVLVYFGEAVVLRGRSLAGGEAVRFDIAIPAAGFYWLEQVTLDDGTHLLTRQRSDCVPFLGLLPHRAAAGRPSGAI